jgi:hypothetical protein
MSATSPQKPAHSRVRLHSGSDEVHVQGGVTGTVSPSARRICVEQADPAQPFNGFEGVVGAGALVRQSLLGGA